MGGTTASCISPHTLGSAAGLHELYPGTNLVQVITGRPRWSSGYPRILIKIEGKNRGEERTTPVTTAFPEAGK